MSTGRNCIAEEAGKGLNRINKEDKIDGVQEEEVDQPYLEFSVNYDQDTSILSVFVSHTNSIRGLLEKCKSAQAMSDDELEATPMNPFVRVSLLPGCSLPPQHGNVHRSTSKPYFQEHFHYNVPATEITLKTLQIAIYQHSDAPNKPELCLGHMILSLGDLQFNQVLPFRRPILPDEPVDSEVYFTVV